MRSFCRKTHKTEKRICVLCNKEFNKPIFFKYDICEECDTFKYKNHSLKLLKLRSSDSFKSTLSYFNNKCAYCEVGDYEQIEHFIPIRLGGKTDIFNCVPTCRKCNNRKYIYGNDIPGYERVEKYLKDLKTNTILSKQEIEHSIYILQQAGKYAESHDDELAKWIKENMR